MQRPQQWTSSNYKYGPTKAKRNYGDLGIVIDRNSKQGSKKRHKESSGTDFPEDLDASFNEGTFPIHQKIMTNVKNNRSTPQKINRKPMKTYNFLLPSKKHSGIKDSEFDFETFGKTYGRIQGNTTCFENKTSATEADQKVPNSEVLFKELAEELFGCENEFESFHNDDDITITNDCHLNTTQQCHISKELEYEFNLSFDETTNGENDCQKEDGRLLTTYHSDNELQNVCIGQGQTSSENNKPTTWLHAEKPYKAIFKTSPGNSKVIVNDADIADSRGSCKQLENAKDALFNDKDMKASKDALINDPVLITSNLNENLSKIPFRQIPMNLEKDSLLIMPVEERLDEDDFIPPSQTEQSTSALSKISSCFDPSVNRNMKYHSKPQPVSPFEREHFVEDAENAGSDSNYSEDIVPGSQSQPETSKFIGGKGKLMNMMRPVVSKPELFKKQSQNKTNTVVGLPFAQMHEVITNCTNEGVGEDEGEKNISDGYLGKRKTERSDYSFSVQGDCTCAQNVQLIETYGDLSDGFIPPSQTSQNSCLHQNIPELAVFLSSSKAVSDGHPVQPVRLGHHKPARKCFQL